MPRLIAVTAAAIGAILFVAFVASRVARSRHSGLSIRLQVFLALALILGAFAGGLGVMVFDRVQARAVRFATQAADDEARTAARLLAGELSRRQLALGELARQMAQGAPAREPGSAAFRLFSVSGESLLSPAQQLRGPRASASAPVVVRGVTVGHVEVDKPTVVMQRLLKDLAPTLLLISLVLGAAAAIAAAWIGHSIALPIEALSRFSERVSHGEQGAGPPPRAWGREVVRLSQSIDSMRRQLEGRPFAELFAADLSHELRNPVAAIRASAELLEEGALEEPQQARRFVQSIRQAAERIERLLTDLVKLARMEARGPEAAVPLDMAELLRRALEAVAGGPSHARVEVQAPAELPFVGEPTWLERAMANLIDNALLHSPPESRVQLELQSLRGAVQLTVTNPGAVSPHMRRNLFRRFVTTRQDKGGTGLGLAIARAVAEAHGGRVTLAEPGPPQVSFVMYLPKSRRAPKAPRRRARAWSGS